MNETFDLQKINTRLAVLEERMNTLKAENETAFERLRSDMARRDVETAKRDKDNQRWIIGLVLGCTAIVVGAIALL